ncbi:MAG: LUD domain-containing protein [Chloroflexi bacterium]|nr:LUD domain-containing protein [Chloroflexota bacterium]
MTSTVSPSSEAFAERAQRAGCVIERLPPAESGEAVAAQLLEVCTRLSGVFRPRFAFAPSVAQDYPELVEALRVTTARPKGDVDELRQAHVGLCVARAGLMETGSVVLAGEAPEERLVWLVPRIAVVLLDELSIVPDLDEALTLFGSHREWGAFTLVTGPSRTSDVERVLTVGVQGAETLVIALVAGRSEQK